MKSVGNVVYFERRGTLAGDRGLTELKGAAHLTGERLPLEQGFPPAQSEITELREQIRASIVCGDTQAREVLVSRLLEVLEGGSHRGFVAVTPRS